MGCLPWRVFFLSLMLHFLASAAWTQWIGFRDLRWGMELEEVADLYEAEPVEHVSGEFTGPVYADTVFSEEATVSYLISGNTGLRGVQIYFEDDSGKVFWEICKRLFVTHRVDFLHSTEIRVIGPGVIGYAIYEWNSGTYLFFMDNAIVKEEEEVSGHGVFEVSPLQEAIWTGSKEDVAASLAAGEDVNAPGYDGWLPITWAAWESREEIVKLLLEGGADPNRSNNGDYSLLHSVSWMGHLEATELLIEAGAEVNAQDATGSTPLHEAVMGQKAEIVALLLRAGADVDQRGPYGAPPPLFGSSVAARRHDNGCIAPQRCGSRRPGPGRGTGWDDIPHDNRCPW